MSDGPSKSGEAKSTTAPMLVERQASCIERTRPDECALCEDGTLHHVFITAPPGWGSIMTCSSGSRRQGVVVRNDEEITQLRNQRRVELRSERRGAGKQRRSRIEHAVSAPSGELKVYATKEWAEKAAGGDTERLLVRSVTEGHYGPWRPCTAPESASGGSVTIPRPHVSHGPQGVPASQADADYLREAARKLETHYKPFGSNLRATVVQLIRDAADAIAGDER